MGTNTMLRIITFVRLVWRIEMNNNTYAWNDLLRSMQEQHEMFKNAEPTLQQKLNIANSKLASIEMIMDEYYTGSFTTIEELAGEISAVLIEEDEV